MELIVEKQGGSGLVVLDGDLTIERAGELRDLMLDALARTRTIAMDLSGADSVDLTCLQILCSAHKSAAAQDKEISIRGSASSAFKEAARDSGFSREKGCVKGREDSCLWRSE